MRMVVPFHDGASLVPCCCVRDLESQQPQQIDGAVCIRAFMRAFVPWCVCFCVCASAYFCERAYFCVPSFFVSVSHLSQCSFAIRAGRHIPVFVIQFHMITFCCVSFDMVHYCDLMWYFIRCNFNEFIKTMSE